MAREFASASSVPGNGMRRRQVSRRPRNSAVNLGVLLSAADTHHMMLNRDQDGADESEEYETLRRVQGMPYLQQYMHQNLEDIAGVTIAVQGDRGYTAQG